MIKLDKSKALLNTEGILAVKKVRTKRDGYSVSHNSLEIIYTTGIIVNIDYHYDENYYNKDGDSANSQRMNKDLKQIEEHLLVKG